MISKIRLINYKIFKDETIKFNPDRNILVGENGSGKSSILDAIHFLLSGSLRNIEQIGFEKLINIDAIKIFQNENKKTFKKLPKLIIELYFDSEFEKDNFYLNGKLNFDKTENSGLKLIIEANSNYSEEITKLLANEPDVFPFDYYGARFETFSGKSYTSYNKLHKSKFDFIDSSTFSIRNSINNFVATLYKSKTTEELRNEISHNFRVTTEDFSTKLYSQFKISDEDDYKLKVKYNTSSFSEQYISAYKNDIEINNLGLGEKLLIGINSILKENVQEKHSNKFILVEEPENHLSHVNMKKLINLIESDKNNQMFISTHNNMIASRLELTNLILLKQGKATSLKELEPETSKFFEKAPNTNLLNFILSDKLILVEGDAEYILMEQFFNRHLKEPPEDKGVTIISCGGKTFKRYLEIAKKLKIQVAVITDNDGDFENNITNYYTEYETEKNIKIYSDTNNKNRTFEISLYNNNVEFYEDNIKTSQMVNGVLGYMLNKKTESAFRTLLELEKSETKFDIPNYIKRALNWIN